MKHIHGLTLLTLLLISPLPAMGQTPVAIQNPSFEVGAPAGSPNWNLTVPGWNCSGNYGEFAPTPAQVKSGVDQTSTLWLNSGALCSQDLGPVVPNATYNLTYSVGAQTPQYGPPTGYSASLGMPNCTPMTVTPTSGALTAQALTCKSSASGELILTLSNTGGQALFDNLVLTVTPSGPPPPLVFTIPGLGTATFPMVAPPSCGPNDGTCSIQIQVCDTSVSPPNCITSSQGTIVLIKSVTLPIPQTSAILVVQVTNP